MQEASASLVLFAEGRFATNNATISPSLPIPLPGVVQHQTFSFFEIRDLISGRSDATTRNIGRLFQFNEKFFTPTQ